MANEDLARALIAPAARPMGQRDMLADILRGTPLIERPSVAGRPLQDVVSERLGLDPSLPSRPMILPVARDAEGRVGMAWPQIAVDAVSAAMLPGHVASGGAYTPDDVSNLALNMAGGGLAARTPPGSVTSGITRPIRAFHGSPHDFDRFRMDKIGTGEGAQAYGHGLYFAGNENVARSYRDALLAKANEPQGLRVGNTDIQDLYSRIDSRAARMPAKSAEAEYEKLNALELLMQHGDIPAMREAAKSGQISPEALAWMEREIAPNFTRNGRMYEVNLHADPARMLDWDAPLSQQSQAVQDALAKFGIKADPDAMRAYDDALLAALNDTGPSQLPRQPSDPLGGAIYENSRIVPGSFRDSPAASAALREVGIPGIRYLDAGSRSAGDGTRNYVMFDDNLIEIVRKYGLAGLMALGAAGTAEAGQPPQQ